MFYLLLSVTCGVLVALIFKVIEGKGYNIYAMVSANYVAALVISTFIAASKDTLGLIRADSFAAFAAEWRTVFADMGVFSMEASAAWAILVGVVFGPIFCFSFYRFQRGIEKNGMNLANIFVKLSVIIPMLISMAVWKEYPGWAQSAGILLCILAILLFNLDPRDLRKMALESNLIILALLSGLTQFSAKIYQKYGAVDCVDILTLFIFIFAFATSLFFLFKEPGPIRRKDLAAGGLIGVPNLLFTTFLVLALEQMNTSVAYLLSSLLSVIAVLAIGLLFFKEKLVKKDWVAVGLSIFAIVLVNL